MLQAVHAQCQAMVDDTTQHHASTVKRLIDEHAAEREQVQRCDQTLFFLQSLSPCYPSICARCAQCKFLEPKPRDVALLRVALSISQPMDVAMTSHSKNVRVRCEK